LADSLPTRNERLASADMIATDEAAVLAQTTRAMVDAWIDKGRSIGLAQTNRGYRLPRWQFEPSIWDALPKLTAALNPRDSWALLSFLESPNGALNGITPRAAIEQGQEARVLQVAEAEGFG
jgi:superfamily I DNA/RNA helicase